MPPIKGYIQKAEIKNGYIIVFYRKKDNLALGARKDLIPVVLTQLKKKKI